jgi:hypothetical protein
VPRKAVAAARAAVVRASRLVSFKSVLRKGF